jgi:REP element-mobilizing transposase RayT
VVLDEYVIMPNHIHGILCICRDEAPPRPDKTATLKCRDEAPPRPNKIATVICRDEAPPRPIISPTSSYPLNRRDEIVSRPYDNDNIYSRISPQSGSLSVIIGSFKAKCSKEIRIHYPFVKFQWQSRFYEHIIRNEKSLERIREYIRLNPQKWQFDEEYTGM